MQQPTIDLIQRHAGQLYRLALLYSGNDASPFVATAFRHVSPDDPNPDHELISALAAQRPPLRWQLALQRDQLERAGLRSDEAEALIRLLGRRKPTERLALGMHWLLGSEPTTINGMLGSNRAPLDSAALVAGFRREAAVALRRVPADADTTLLARLDAWLDGAADETEVTSLRALILDDRSVRALRDGLQGTRDLLARALPALVVAPPQLLIDRLYAQNTPAPARPRRRIVPLLGLSALVLAVVAAIIVVPSLLRGGDTAATGTVEAATLLDAAIARFDDPPLGSGILHQRTSIQNGDNRFVIERWYDYASPNRVHTNLLDSNNTVVQSVSTNGRDLVQYRSRRGGSWPNLDITLSENEAAALVPVLRALPAGPSLLFDNQAQVDLGPHYLGQACEHNATFFGATTAHGRPAYLLSYTTSSTPPGIAAANADGWRVVLTLDRQTASLLDVQVVAQGTNAVAVHPVQTEQFEVLTENDDSVFALPGSSNVRTRSSLALAGLPNLPRRMQITLAEAGRTGQPVLVPSELPQGAVRSTVIGTDNDVAWMFEGEHSTGWLVPEQWGTWQNNASPEETAGSFRFQMLVTDSNSQSSAALISTTDQPASQRVLMVVAPSATAAEREAQLRAIIGTLTTLTPNNSAQLGQTLQIDM